MFFRPLPSSFRVLFFDGTGFYVYEWKDVVCNSWWRNPSLYFFRLGLKEFF